MTGIDKLAGLPIWTDFSPPRPIGVSNKDGANQSACHKQCCAGSSFQPDISKNLLIMNEFKFGAMASIILAAYLFDFRDNYIMWFLCIPPIVPPSLLIAPHTLIY